MLLKIASTIIGGILGKGVATILDCDKPTTVACIAGGSIGGYVVGNEIEQSLTENAYRRDPDDSPTEDDEEIPELQRQFEAFLRWQDTHVEESDVHDREKSEQDELEEEMEEFAQEMLSGADGDSQEDDSEDDELDIVRIISQYRDEGREPTSMMLALLKARGLKLEDIPMDGGGK